MIPAVTWYRHIARHKGRALALLKAAEKGGLRAVRALTETWGLIWGADIHYAEHLEPTGVLPTADEVLRRMERVAMAERAQLWRRGFDAVTLAEKRHQLDDDPDAPELRARRIATREAATELAAAVDELAAALPTLPAAQAVYLAARRRANADRTADIARSLHRLRHPDEPVTARVSLRKRARVSAPAPAPQLVPPPTSWRSDTCSGCGGTLAAVLVPYGCHVGC